MNEESTIYLPHTANEKTRRKFEQTLANCKSAEGMSDFVKRRMAEILMEEQRERERIQLLFLRNES